MSPDSRHASIPQWQRHSTFDTVFVAALEGELAMAYRLAGYLLADSAEAQDAVQEASVRAWRGWTDLRERETVPLPGSARSWSTSAALGSASGAGVGPWTWKTSISKAAIRSGPRSPAIRSAARSVVLSQELRMVVVLRYWGDLSLAEIADRLRIPIGTVKSRHHAALQALRRRIEPVEGGTR